MRALKQPFWFSATAFAVFLTCFIKPLPPPVANQSHADSATVSDAGKQTIHHFQTTIRDLGTHARQLQLNYLLFLPRSYTPRTKKRYPLLLYLHGAGESGTDTDDLRSYGPPYFVESHPDLPIIVLSPQAPQAIGFQPFFEEIKALLSDVQMRYPVDAKRIYLTGNSMGGNGVWDLALAIPTRFAAIAPVASFYTSDIRKICLLKDLPIWIIHGQDDAGIPVEGAKQLAKALENCGGHPKLTVLQHTNHVATNDVFTHANFYDWLISQHKQ